MTSELAGSYKFVQGARRQVRRQRVFTLRDVAAGQWEVRRGAGGVPKSGEARLERVYDPATYVRTSLPALAPVSYECCFST